MHYRRKKTKDNDDEFFIYQPKYIKKDKTNKKIKKQSPFEKLSELRFR